MPLLARIIGCLLVCLTALIRSSAAQGILPSPPLESLVPQWIEEIRETTDGIVVRGSYLHREGGMQTLEISCFRLASGNTMLVIQDVRDAMTDDRIFVEATFCDRFRTAVRQRANR